MTVAEHVSKCGWVRKICMLLVLGALPACAGMNMPVVFSDHMVLQRDMAVPVWGTSEAGEKITVEYGGQKKVATADKAGNWMVKLSPMPASFEPCILRISGSSSQQPITIKDVLVGEVWLCSGQSNMAWTNKGTLLSNVCAQVCAEADYPQLRGFHVIKSTAQTPQRSVAGSWMVCNPTNAAEFSATGYFFGRNLCRDLKVPVGLIVSAAGGTPSEAWTSLSALEKDPAYPEIAAKWEKTLADYPAAIQSYEQVAIPDWRKAVAEAKAEGKPVPHKPREPKGPAHTSRPANLFNAMIAPLIPFSIRGVAWYQGESNADTMQGALQYYTLFPSLIRDWRARWGQGDVPFLFVQLANFRALQTKAVENTSWPFLREAQTRTLSLANTGMAVAIDVNDESDNIHPQNKQEVGRRLSLVALAQVYGQRLSYSGPVYDGMKVKGDKAVVRFKHADGGLVVRLTDARSKLNGFALAGQDGKFVWANAVADGNSVVVSSPEVAKPVSVRYSWAMNPIGNLYNGTGLPTSPFRTDD